MASNLHSEHPPQGPCQGPGRLFLAGRLFHFPQCYNGLVSRRNRNLWWHDMAKRGFHCLHPQSPASKTLSHSGLLHCDELTQVVQCQSDGCSLSNKDGWYRRIYWFVRRLWAAVKEPYCAGQLICPVGHVSLLNKCDLIQTQGPINACMHFTGSKLQKRMQAQTMQQFVGLWLPQP